MRNRRRHDVAAPGVLHDHGQTRRHAEVPDLLGLGEPAHLGDLQIDAVHGVVGQPTQQHVDAVDVLVQDEGERRAAADRQALLIGRAGLLDIDIDVAHRIHHARRLVHGPACVGIGRHEIARLDGGAAGLDALDVFVRIPAHLELEALIALLAVAGDVLGHLVGGALGDSAVKGNALLLGAAQQLVDGKACLLAEDVPAGDVDGGLHVRVAAHDGVHVPVEGAELCRVLADELRR